jgi:hypothetical protein
MLGEVTVLYVEKSMSGRLCERRGCAAVLRRIVRGVVRGAVSAQALLPLAVRTVLSLCLCLLVVFTPRSPFLAPTPSACGPSDLR